MIVLQLLSEASVPLSELVRPYQTYQASGEINTEVASPAATVAQVAELMTAQGAAVDLLDGLTVDHGSWWFNLRPSNTEPLLRLNVEAPSAADVDVHVAEVLALVASLQEA